MNIFNARRGRNHKSYIYIYIYIYIYYSLVALYCFSCACEALLQPIWFRARPWTDLFQDSSIAVGSRDSARSSSISEGNTGSSRYRRGGSEAALRWRCLTQPTSLRERREEGWSAGCGQRNVWNVWGLSAWMVTTSWTITWYIAIHCSNGVKTTS